MFLIFQKSRWQVLFWTQTVDICSTEVSGALACAMVGNKIRYCNTTLIGCKPTRFGRFTQGKWLHGGLAFTTRLGSQAWPTGVINALPN